MSETEFNSLTIHSAVKQVEACGFECEAGSIDKNIGWAFLANHLKAGPKFAMGQRVDYEVVAEVKEIRLSQVLPFTIVGISMGSDTDRRIYSYAISNDPPDAYHYGKVSFSGIAESALSATK